ncbi:MAG: thioredoxin family protein [Cyanobacteriota bacterium]|jgi:thioredoxin 1
MADLSPPSGTGVEQLSDASVAAGALGHGDLVLLDVWAAWCGPCRLMAPLMDWAAATYGDKLRVAKLEADPNPLTVEKLGIQGLPTLILFRQGQEISRHEGAIPQAQLQAFVEAHL